MTRNVDYSIRNVKKGANTLVFHRRPADPIGVRIGKQIQRAREAAGLTQAQLAEKAGVHRTYVSQLERDLKSPTLDVFFRLCRATGIAPSTLIARIERQHQEG